MIMTSQFPDGCPEVLEGTEVTSAQLLLIYRLFLPLKVHSATGVIKRKCLFDKENSRPVIVPVNRVYLLNL